MGTLWSELAPVADAVSNRPRVYADANVPAGLVAFNSIFQILAYALLGTFYLAILPGWLGLDTQDVAFSTWGITKAVLIFLGIALAFARKVRAGDNPWGEGATTLEWTLSSPPPFHQYSELPKVN